MSTRRTLVEDCLFWIRTTDYVSFPELERWLTGRGIDVAGNYALDLGRNVVIWAGVSQQFCDIFDELRPHLDFIPCSSLLVYLIDGKMLGLPIAKRPPRNGYAKPHWAPATLRTKRRPTEAEIRAALIEEAKAE
jgi:hypothetical protein